LSDIRPRSFLQRPVVSPDTLAIHHGNVPKSYAGYILGHPTAVMNKSSNHENVVANSDIFFGQNVVGDKPLRFYAEGPVNVWGNLQARYRDIIPAKMLLPFTLGDFQNLYFVLKPFVESKEWSLSPTDNMSCGHSKNLKGAWVVRSPFCNQEAATSNAFVILVGRQFRVVNVKNTIKKPVRGSWHGGSGILDIPFRIG
jgi:hypothetical protein